MPATLDHIWIKRAHRGPMDPVNRATLVAGRGLEGNANYGGRRQVTLLSREQWADATRTLGADVAPAARRANLFITGLDFEQSRGRVIRIGACRIRVLGETRPCERMDEACDGLRAALDPHWRGGAFGEVLDDGEVIVGDLVDWEDTTVSRGVEQSQTDPT
jgi:MOSC domain-containing protein YiiM